MGAGGDDAGPTDGGEGDHSSSATVLGGGMCNYGSNSMVTNFTLSGNFSAYGGGEMYNAGESLTVTNCIFWRDSPNEIVNGSSTPTIRFSDVHGGLPAGTVDGGGNIDSDPMFVRNSSDGGDGWGDDPGTPDVDEGVNDDYGDLRVQGGSPAINAGDLTLFAAPGETDLDEHARVLCGRVDMGAYEFGIGDYDCDRSVNLMDFNAWKGCMTDPHDVRGLAPAALTGPRDQSAIDNRQLAIGCEGLDFAGDGDVDLLDFAAFQSVLAAP